jgi:hypothetical protein
VRLEDRRIESHREIADDRREMTALRLSWNQPVSQNGHVNAYNKDRRFEIAVASVATALWAA